MAAFFSGKQPGGSPGRRFSWIARTGMIIVALNILAALFGPMLAAHSPGEILSTTAFAPPGDVGLLGADCLGRDICSRLLYGARLTVGLAFAATLIGFAIGITLGLIAAEASGIIDTLITRCGDIMMSYPPILFALILITGMGSSNYILVLAIAIPQAARVTRVSRSIAMDIGTREFVAAARARGENLWSIIRLEIFPNTVGLLVCEFGLRMAYSVLTLASLSFLGLGIQPPAADWGQMVRENISGLLYGSWAALLPAGAIAMFAVAINLVVDELGQDTSSNISQELL